MSRSGDGMAWHGMAWHGMSIVGCGCGCGMPLFLKYLVSSFLADPMFRNGQGKNENGNTGQKEEEGEYCMKWEEYRLLFLTSEASEAWGLVGLAGGRGRRKGGVTGWKLDWCAATIVLYSKR
jgi:hypothetical protein